MHIGVVGVSQISTVPTISHIWYNGGGVGNEAIPTLLSPQAAVVELADLTRPVAQQVSTPYGNIQVQPLQAQVLHTNFPVVKSAATPKKSRTIGIKPQQNRHQIK